jgi:hypothetical protein
MLFQPSTSHITWQTYVSKRLVFLLSLIFFVVVVTAQTRWVDVDSLFQPLPSSMHVYKTSDSLDGKPFIAYYVEANLKSKGLTFLTDTTHDRRLTPSQFYERNDSPVVVVNGTFFSFDTKRNLNVVVKNGKLVSLNQTSTPTRGKDTGFYHHVLRSAIGINRCRQADVVWTFTDSSRRRPYASQTPYHAVKTAERTLKLSAARQRFQLKKWRTANAIGGGPVLVQKGKAHITNEEERMFTGKGLQDKHPRTLMGYTADKRLIIMAIEGRNPGKADGATLIQEARIMVELGCVEALNLDGGGSSCMLINGKETIKPSDKNGQRPVPAVFLINRN